MTDSESLSFLKLFLEDQATLMRKIHSKPDWKYGGFEELVLDCGLEMEAGPLPKGIKLGLPKSCYWNCQKLISKRKNLFYVEGYVLNREISFPIAHAWLTTKNKEVIDPTLREPGIYYFGIPFSTQWIKNLIKSRKKRNNISIFEGNYIEKYSLLVQGLPAEALACLDEPSLKSQDTSHCSSSLI